jgi:hypothetical protein
MKKTRLGRNLVKQDPPPVAAKFPMPFNKENAIQEIKRALNGATARDKNAVFQKIVDEHASQNNPKKMCFFPQCGTWMKKGNHNWEDIQRLISACCSMNSPLVTIVENPHCDTTILCSSNNAAWDQEMLPNGQIRVYVTMDVDKPVGITSTIKEVAGMDKSPFNKKRKLPETPPKAAFTRFVSASSVLPELDHVPEIIANLDYASNFEFVESLFADSPLPPMTPAIIQQAPVIVTPRPVKTMAPVMLTASPMASVTPRPAKKVCTRLIL